MLLVEPRFLPLQPLSDPAYSARLGLSQLPASCSITSLRQSFHPFPLRPATPSTPLRRSEELEVLRERKPPSERQDISMRAMRGNDVAAVRRLQSECLPLAYPSSFYTLLLTNPSSLCLLAVSPACPSSILGCISGHLLPYTHCSLADDGVALDSSTRTTELPIIYLTSLAIDCLARNQGLGFRLVHRLVTELLSSSSAKSTGAGRAAVLQLHVEAKNDAAIRLYERVGLKETRRIKGYYKGIRGGGDAIEMRGIVRV
ncbi:hypothetical protein JCM11491_005347 [Sporobolomyces phaffii]